jgi:putative acetyltransferase
MLTTFVIAPERPDHPEVAALLAELDRYLASLYPPEANHILDLHALAAPEVSFYAARLHGRLAGCAAVRRQAGEAATQGEAYGEVKRMMVRPDCRGRGIGASLLRTLERRLREQRIGLALLETGRTQHEAVRLYETAGYRPREAFGGYPDNGLSAFYAKRLDLSAQGEAAA